MCKCWSCKSKTQKMCDKVVDFFQLLLIFLPDKMYQKLDNTVFCNDDIIFNVMDSDIVTYFSSDMGLNTINLNNVNLDVDNFDDYDPKTINHVRLMTWYNRLIDISNIKHVKKNRWRISACSMAFNKDMWLKHVTKSKK